MDQSSLLRQKKIYLNFALIPSSVYCDDMESESKIRTNKKMHLSGLLQFIHTGIKKIYNLSEKCEQRNKRTVTPVVRSNRFSGHRPAPRSLEIQFKSSSFASASNHELTQPTRTSSAICRPDHLSVVSDSGEYYATDQNLYYSKS